MQNRAEIARFCTIHDAEEERRIFEEPVPASHLDSLGVIADLLNSPLMIDQLIADTRERAMELYDEFRF